MRQNQFSKLKKAISENDKVGMYRALMAIPVLARHPARARRAVTRGAYIKNEVNRALNALGRTGNWTPALTEAFELVKAKAGESVWNEAIYKAPDLDAATLAAVNAGLEQAKVGEFSTSPPEVATTS